MDQKEIQSLIPEINLKEFAECFLLEYLEDGFGTAGKRDTDLHVFHLLESLGGLDEKDNAEISLLLQIPESKVKAYRYESKLRYPPTEPHYIERRILWALSKSEFDADSKRIKFIMEDPYVRKALQAESKRLGGVPDTSFNTEIVALRPEQLTALLKKLYGKEVAREFGKEFNDVLNKDSELSFDDIKKRFALSLAGSAGVIGGSLAEAIKIFLSGE